MCSPYPYPYPYPYAYAYAYASPYTLTPTPTPTPNQAQTAWIVRGVLLALDYMHTTRKAIHRDIKAPTVESCTQPYP